MVRYLLKSLVKLAVLLVWLPGSGGVVSAQDYPSKPIRLIVPAPAGGGTDILARVLGEGLAKQWGQTVVVDNRGGASGMIAGEAAARSAPDGYTLFVVYSGILTVNPSMFKNIPYNAIKDFAPVALIADVPNILIVHPSLPATSVRELIKMAKSKPGQLTYASSGNGVSNHLAMELFKMMAGLNMVHVPYKGGAPAMQDLLGGHVQLMFNNLVEALAQVKAGRLRALAVATAARSPAVPELPTVAESGVPGYEISLWYGVVAPAGTPQAIVDKLNDVVRQMNQTPGVKARLAQLGADPIDYRPVEFSAKIKREMEKWGKVIKEAGIRAE
ncbi:MAG: tripartite tricarboxylate transporter substrate binding protein [Betaproteobacteria bacterium]|nr:tripartite tricarboxylate transporter substrate binding protein [Betaproteobacteria bacterium]